MNIKELHKRFEAAKLEHSRRGQVNFNNIVAIFVGLLIIAMIAVLYFISLATMGGLSTSVPANSSGNVTNSVNNLMATGSTVVSFVPVIAIVAIIVAVLLALRFLQQ